MKIHFIPKIETFLSYWIVYNAYCGEAIEANVNTNVVEGMVYHTLESHGPFSLLVCEW